MSNSLEIRKGSQQFFASITASLESYSNFSSSIVVSAMGQTVDLAMEALRGKVESGTKRSLTAAEKNFPWATRAAEHAALNAEIAAEALLRSEMLANGWVWVPSKAKCAAEIATIPYWKKTLTPETHICIYRENTGVQRIPEWRLQAYIYLPEGKVVLNKMGTMSETLALIEKALLRVKAC